MYDVSTLDVHRENFKRRLETVDSIAKQGSLQNNQDFSLDGLRESF
jgi:hypothetical protein